MKKYFIIWLLLFVSLLRSYAQFDHTSLYVEAQGGYITSGTIPFWLRSNQFGSIPVDGASGSLTGAFRKDYDTATGILDWGASVEGRLNAGHKTNLTLIEGYGKMRVGIFEVKAGRIKEVIGLCDSSLSSGSWSVSGNAPGIPNVQLAIPEFYTIPWFGGLFAFKGLYAHGWLGKTLMRADDSTGYYDSYIHQKLLYGRFGKPGWKWKLYGGFNHQTKWGDEQDFYNDNFTLSTFETYLYVITGKRYNKGSIEMTRLGDHLGSIDIGFQYDFKNLKLLLYRQNFYEAGALAHLANIEDGLNGIHLENRKSSDHLFRWKKILFEFLYTKNQAGEPWSPPTTSPYEGYYNHYQYAQGWSYHGLSLGTPFITPKNMAREDLPSHPSEYFCNNRARVFHIGFEGSVERIHYTLKVSWSNNYGTYQTTDEEQSTNIANPGYYGIFGRQDQFSAYFECERGFKKGLNLGCIIAFDIGELFYDSAGVLIKLSEHF